MFNVTPMYKNKEDPSVDPHLNDPVYHSSHNSKNVFSRETPNTYDRKTNETVKGKRKERGGKGDIRIYGYS